MAYPTIDAPYGYKPTSLIGGQPFAGSTRNLPVQYNYNTNLFYGDLVTLLNGYVVLATYPVNTTNTTVGVFLGCYFTNPVTKQRLWSQFYPANTTAGDITAVVADDPDTVFRVCAATAAGALTVGSLSSIVVGQNVAGTTNTGTLLTGNGQGGVVNAAANTASAGFRVLALVPDTQIATPAVYVSGTGTTTLTVSGLTVGQVIPIGTDVFNNVNGQLQFTGSATTAAVTVASATAQALTVVASTQTVVGSLVLVQSPEALVKLNFNCHRYNIA
jgi:hypothetical protein